MLVSMRELLADAREGNYAVGSFNCPGLEYVQAVVRAAEALGKSVILSFPQVHEKTVPLRVIGPVLLRAAEDASVPVCVHLDHGSTTDYVRQALELGFPSVMIDGSRLPLAENIALTRQVVELAARYGADVEAELGGISGDEAGVAAGEPGNTALTDPAEAERFLRETGIGSLAASFGTAHGFYTAPPKLRHELIRELAALGVPLVMHGGSGVSPEDYALAISEGVRKINYYSYMAQAGVRGVRELLERRDVRYFHELALAASAAMEADVRQAIELFHPGT